MVNIEPTGEHAVPYNLDTEEAKNFHDTVVVAANTADLLEELGASIEIEKDDIDKTLELFKASNRHVAKHALKQPSTASAASLFLRSYANQVATDAAEIRSAVLPKQTEPQYQRLLLPIQC